MKSKFALLALPFIGFMLLEDMAYAQPAYLNCTLEKREGSSNQYVFSLKVDEGSSKVTHSTGKASYNVEAFFTPNEINYKVGKANPSIMLSMESKFSIDRVTLKVVREFTFSSVKGLKVSKDKGTCKLVVIKGRKF